MGFNGRPPEGGLGLSLSFICDSCLNDTSAEHKWIQGWRGLWKAMRERRQAQKKKGPGLSGIQFSFLIGDCFSPRPPTFSTEASSRMHPGVHALERARIGPRCRRKCPRSGPRRDTCRDSSSLAAPCRRAIGHHGGAQNQCPSITV